MRFDPVPVAAELVPLYLPRAPVQLGGLASPQNDRTAIAVESHAIWTVHRAVSKEQRLSRKYPRQGFAVDPRVPRRLDRRIRPNVGEGACIEYEPKKPAEIPEAHSAPEVWGTMDNDQIVSRDDKGVLTPVARGKERARRECDRRRRASIDRSDPPQISVAGADLGLRVGLCALLYPERRDELSIAPTALVEIEQREPGQIASTHQDRVGGIDRVVAGEIFAVTRLVTLHADWSGNLALECVEYRRAHGALVDRSERIEVPIVVIPERPRLVAEARRTLGRRLRRLVESCVIDARAGLKKIAHGRGFLLRGQRRLIVVDAERADRL